MYKALAQSVILYGSESWVVTGDMLKVLKVFHHYVARRIIGMTDTLRSGREWEYPPVMTEMEAVVLHPLREYMCRQQAIIPENVAWRPIYELCVEMDWLPGTIQMVIWWDHNVINKPEEYTKILRNTTYYRRSSSLTQGRKEGPLIHI